MYAKIIYQNKFFVIGNLDLKDTCLLLRFDLIFLSRLEIKKDNVDEDSVVPYSSVRFVKKEIASFPVPRPSYYYLNTLLLLLWMPDRKIGWENKWIIDWMIDCLIKWMIDWFNEKNYLQRQLGTRTEYN